MHWKGNLMANTAFDPKQWKVPKRGQTTADTALTMINPGDAGIWITCDMYKEGKCTAEARDICNEVGRSHCSVHQLVWTFIDIEALSGIVRKQNLQ